MPAGYYTGGTLNSSGAYTAGYNKGKTDGTNEALASTAGTATATQILSGYTAWVNGSKVTGNMAQQSASNLTLDSGKTKTYSAGYYPNAWTVTSGGSSTQEIWFPSYEINGHGGDGGHIYSTPDVNSYRMVLLLQLAGGVSNGQQIITTGGYKLMTVAEYKTSGPHIIYNTSGTWSSKIEYISDTQFRLNDSWSDRPAAMVVLIK